MAARHVWRSLPGVARSDLQPRERPISPRLLRRLAAGLGRLVGAVPRELRRRLMQLLERRMQQHSKPGRRGTVAAPPTLANPLPLARAFACPSHGRCGYRALAPGRPSRCASRALAGCSTSPRSTLGVCLRCRNATWCTPPKPAGPQPKPTAKRSAAVLRLRDPRRRTTPFAPPLPRLASPMYGLVGIGWRATARGRGSITSPSPSGSPICCSAASTAAMPPAATPIALPAELAAEPAERGRASTALGPTGMVITQIQGVGT